MVFSGTEIPAIKGGFFRQLWPQEAEGQLDHDIK